MSLREQFLAEVAERYGRVAGPELLPLVLAEVCAEVLSVDGAGLSLTGDLRVPLAASNDLTGHAERLQTTLGDGPCLTATATSTPLVADNGVIGSRWPMFHHGLTDQTPFRSVASFPLPESGRPVVGALDVYSTDPEAARLHDLAVDSQAIADQIAVILLTAPTVDEDGDPTYTWMSAAPVTADATYGWPSACSSLTAGSATTTPSPSSAATPSPTASPSTTSPTSSANADSHPTTYSSADQRPQSSLSVPLVVDGSPVGGDEPVLLHRQRGVRCAGAAPL